MKLFLDTSVLLSACGSGKSASRFVLEEAGNQGWELASDDYCREETLRNLDKLGSAAKDYFRKRADVR